MRAAVPEERRPSPGPVSLPVLLISLLIGLFCPTELYCYSQDTTCGIAWYPAIQLSDDTISSLEPQITASGDDVAHVTWNTISPDYTIMKLPYARIVWGTVESIRDLLRDSTRFPFRVNGPVISSDENQVRIFFTGATTSHPPVYMITSIDYGYTWGKVLTVSTDSTGRVYSPTEAGQSVAVLYPPHTTQHQPLKILRSTNDGTNWSRTNEDLDDYATIALTPAGILHLTQHSFLLNAAEVEYRRSTNLGTSWEIDTVLSAADGIYSDLPAITGYQSECGTELLAAWRDVKYGGYGFAGASIISRTSLTNGKQWLPEVLQTTYPNGYNPSVALHGNTRAVGWDAEVVAFDSIHAIARASNTSLLTFCPPADLTTDQWGGGDIQLAVSSHAVHVVYEAKVGSAWRIFYRRGEFISTNASISLSTGLVEFDTTEINATTTDTVLVSNMGTEPLVVGTGISDNENFSVMPTADTIPPAGNHPFVVRYTPRSFGTHSGRIVLYHNGQSSPDCFTVSGTSKWHTVSVRYQPGAWQMVSRPVNDGPLPSLPSLFSFDGNYVARDTMLFGIGYWAKPADSVMEYIGIAATSEESVAVRPGWNLIGTLAVAIPTGNIISEPDTIIGSNFFWFNGKSYSSADTLFPGRSYWVKAKEGGRLILK